MKEQPHFKERANLDRRQNEYGFDKFPMAMASGAVVLRDRRVTPDRRGPGIETEELTVSPEEFNKLFEISQSN